MDSEQRKLLHARLKHQWLLGPSWFKEFLDGLSRDEIYATCLWMHRQMQKRDKRGKVVPAADGLVEFDGKLYKRLD